MKNVLIICVLAIAVMFLPSCQVDSEFNLAKQGNEFDLVDKVTNSIVDIDWQKNKLAEDIVNHGGKIVTFEDHGCQGFSVEVILPVTITRGPDETICLYDAGGYAIPLRDSRMLYRGIIIRNGLTDQLFSLSTPIVLAEAGSEDPDGPQDATDHMYASFCSIYGTMLSPPLFCLDIEASFDSTPMYSYAGALSVSNIQGDLITSVLIRYQFGSFYYDGNWSMFEDEFCEELRECDGCSPCLTGGGGN